MKSIYLKSLVVIALLPYLWGCRTTAQAGTPIAVHLPQSTPEKTAEPPAIQRGSTSLAAERPPIPATSLESGEAQDTLSTTVDMLLWGASVYMATAGMLYSDNPSATTAALSKRTDHFSSFERDSKASRIQNAMAELTVERAIHNYNRSVNGQTATSNQ